MVCENIKIVMLCWDSINYITTYRILLEKNRAFCIGRSYLCTRVEFLSLSDGEILPYGHTTTLYSVSPQNPLILPWKDKLIIPRRNWHFL